MQLLRTIKVKRSVYETKKYEKGGYAKTKIGEENVTVEVNVDSDKLFGIYSNAYHKIVNCGSNRSTALQGAVVIKVVKKEKA